MMDSYLLNPLFRCFLKGPCLESRPSPLCKLMICKYLTGKSLFLKDLAWHSS
jgi:hypothetical protein